MWRLRRQVAILQEALEKLSQWCYENSFIFPPGKLQSASPNIFTRKKIIITLNTLLLWLVTY